MRGRYDKRPKRKGPEGMIGPQFPCQIEREAHPKNEFWMDTCKRLPAPWQAFGQALIISRLWNPLPRDFPAPAVASENSTGAHLKK